MGNLTYLEAFEDIVKAILREIKPKEVEPVFEGVPATMLPCSTKCMIRQAFDKITGARANVCSYIPGFHDVTQALLAA